MGYWPNKASLFLLLFCLQISDLFVDAIFFSNYKYVIYNCSHSCAIQLQNRLDFGNFWQNGPLALMKCQKRLPVNKFVKNQAAGSCRHRPRRHLSRKCTVFLICRLGIDRIGYCGRTGRRRRDSLFPRFASNEKPATLDNDAHWNWVLNGNDHLWCCMRRRRTSAMQPAASRSGGMAHIWLIP
jgi:hypothetical protein